MRSTSVTIKRDYAIGEQPEDRSDRAQEKYPKIGQNHGGQCRSRTYDLTDVSRVL